MHKILIIDDEKDLCLVLGQFLSKNGFDVYEANTGKHALEIARESIPDLIFCDYKLQDMDGSSVLKAIKAINPSIPVIIITGFSNIKTAVEVMRLGAADYLIKPLIPEEILLVARKALHIPKVDPVERSFISAQGSDVSERNSWDKAKQQRPEYIFGDSTYSRNIIRQINLVAPTNYSVIIYGESGSGKEAIAQEIHKKSKRKDKPFVAIDCGVLSKELATSELFGHEKGSFTGAHTRKIGSFEVANGGTVFLDEISNLSYDVQIALLRVVQERKMRRVGGVSDIDLDVRIIVASNEKLWAFSGNGKIREDLYHRFNEFTINVAPLRERLEDIMNFANHFLEQANDELNKNVKGFHSDVEEIFKNYVWHGNLRELKNVVKRAALLCDDELIDVKSIPFELVNYSKLQFEKETDEASAMPSSFKTSDVKEIKDHSLKSASIDAEYELILEALKKVNFNKSKAAKELQVDRKTLYNKIKQYWQLRGGNN